MVADHQEAGRGRRGRSWEAPIGASLLCTVLLRPRAAHLGATTMALGLAAAEAIEELAGVRVGLKWPNDLVWPGDGVGTDRKVAGMLAEVDWPAASTIAGGWAEPAASDRVAVAAGIGINVAWAGAMPEELAETAVALDEIAAGRVPDRVDLLVGLLRALDRWMGRLDRAGEDPDAGVAAVQAAWRERSATIGRRVRVDLGVDDVTGTAVDITEAGHLLVRTDTGETRELAVGDVVHLRPLTD